MSKTAGLVLILSGLAVAGYGLSEPLDSSQQTDVTKPPTTERAADRAVAVSEVRPAFRRTASFEAPAEVVFVAPRSRELPSPSQHLAIPKDRDTLARDLQKELRRVGCYDGEITGVWSSDTRRAMKAFIERMNARLPLEEPDPVLYTMVQGEREVVCGRPCSAGESLSADGRCAPAAILAKMNRKVTPPGSAPGSAVVVTASKMNPQEKPPTLITGWSTTTTLAAPAPAMTSPHSESGTPLIEGRMGLAGPNVGPAPAALPPRSRATRTTERAAPLGPGGGRQRWSTAVFSPRNSNN
jgi:peptidoglycan hydrolase-like protein with peptidoglycan-binding domain